MPDAPNRLLKVRFVNGVPAGGDGDVETLSALIDAMTKMHVELMAKMDELIAKTGDAK